MTASSNRSNSSSGDACSFTKTKGNLSISSFAAVRKSRLRVPLRSEDIMGSRFQQMRAEDGLPSKSAL
eukprot:6326691-Pyramimonas_sp.AAC.1